MVEPLTRLSDTSFQLNWTTGQSIHVADRGPYLDSSVTLGSICNAAKASLTVSDATVIGVVRETA